jgi:hypothetical protein
MSVYSDSRDRIAEDPVGKVLKWILLVVGIATFAMLG